MIKVDDAIKRALRFREQLEFDLGDSGKTLIPSLAPRLEDIEQDETTGDWLITISFRDEEASIDSFPRESRTYRRFTIGGASGEVKSMKHIIP
jgi:hypothetical protein